ncbi:MAG: M28 family peptidase [Paludibacteraceae bacterium]
MMRLTHLTIAVLVACTLVACHGTRSDKTSTASVIVPTFNADSAYAFVQAQVAFGPRVPETASHDACAEYLTTKLQQFGAQVEVQQGQMPLYNGEIKTLKNIIGRFGVDANRRILLCAHWDSRPFADHDANPDNHRKPILGANDGASGVGVLLEVARQIAQNTPTVGVDVIFFDLEDWGTPEFDTDNERADAWCLGSQYWAAASKGNNYRAEYGILLDMVGAPGACFYREQISTYFAKDLVDNVWETAQALGFGAYFVDTRGGAITDDHYYVNTIAGIPCIDIIQYNPYGNTGFADYWHTTADDMRHIDRRTLYVVGQTLLQVIYTE